jgi:hypothetical protein
VTSVTPKRPSNVDNHFSEMKRLRQLVGALLVLAVAALMPAPLLACAHMPEQCPMMSQPQAADEMEMGGDDCCPQDAPQASSATQCHETEMAMPSDCAMSSRCCEMASAPASDPAQLSAEKQIAVDVQTRALTVVFVPITSRDERPLRIFGYTKPIFELKTDLRI